MRMGSGIAVAVPLQSADLTAHAADTALHSSGRYLGRVKMVAGTGSFVNHAYTDWAQSQLQVEIGSRPVVVRAVIPAVIGLVGGSVTAYNVNVAIKDVTASEILVEAAPKFSADYPLQSPFVLEADHNPAAGTRTYIIQYKIQAVYGPLSYLASYDSGAWGWGANTQAKLEVIEQ